MMKIQDGGALCATSPNKYSMVDDVYGHCLCSLFFARVMLVFIYLFIRIKMATSMCDTYIFNTSMYRKWRKFKMAAPLCATPANKYSMSSDQHFPSTHGPRPLHNLIGWATMYWKYFRIFKPNSCFTCLFVIFILVLCNTRLLLVSFECKYNFS